MNAIQYLHILKNEMHSVIFGTVDENQLPVTCVVDIMLADENGLYFLTAKGKSFYGRLKATPFISLTGMKGKDTLSSRSITLRGKVREIGSQLLPEIFHQNPYMADIYPDEISRSALTVFQIYEGTGEFFDLSCRPIFRETFSFGGMKAPESGFYVTEKCTGCKSCYQVCPQKCINVSICPSEIQQKHCLRCGKCQEICPQQAIERR